MFLFLTLNLFSSIPKCDTSYLSNTENCHPFTSRVRLCAYVDTFSGTCYTLIHRVTHKFTQAHTHTSHHTFVLPQLLLPPRIKSPLKKSSVAASLMSCKRPIIPPPPSPSYVCVCVRCELFFVRCVFCSLSYTFTIH